MKIRIVTFQRANNYGAVLQCYALYSFLKEHNADTAVIDYLNPNIDAQYNIVPGSNALVRFAAGLVKRMHPNYSWQFIRKKRFDEFRKKIEFTSALTISDLKANGIDCDLIISGSDQVLNPNITNGFDDVYYLNFNGQFLKATYAASIGNINSLLLKNDDFKTLVDNFDFLSVRENDAKEYISALLNKDVIQCVDPTLLISKEQWEKVISGTRYNSPKDYILLYYLERNPALIEATEAMAQKEGLKVLYFNKNAGLTCDSVFCGDAGPLEFIYLIKNAKIVITSSFHASLFSLMFSKTVYIMAHSQTGSRIVSLARLFGAENSVFESLSEMQNKNNAPSLDNYNNPRLKNSIEESKNYLLELIKQGDKNEQTR